MKTDSFIWVSVKSGKKSHNSPFVISLLGPLNTLLFPFDLIGALNVLYADSVVLTELSSDSQLSIPLSANSEFFSLLFGLNRFHLQSLISWL